MKNDQLIIFFDGNCPLCALEMKKLKAKDHQHKIQLINLHQPDFNIQFPHIDINKGLLILHGEYQGDLLLGLEVTHKAWTLVGKGWMVAPLQWPLIKQISHLLYLLLARYRYSISSFMYHRFGIGIKGGINQCQEGTCYEKSNHINHRGK